ncbi:MAG: hypothetical protein Q4D41_02320 [Prevotellaceae bacterium]|nr:hypothetical protein [Prevotellaceae bacterium]
MKKFLYFFTMALFALTATTLYSCSDDDDEAGGGGDGNSITINGVSYPRSQFITSEGSLGHFCVTVTEQVGSSTDVLYYEFSYEDTVHPSVGYDFSTKSLELGPMDSSFHMYKRVSGTATVVSVDVENGLIKIDFDNLKMSYAADDSYTFDGTIWVDYNFGR